MARGFPINKVMLMVKRLISLLHKGTFVLAQNVWTDLIICLPAHVLFLPFLSFILHCHKSPIVFIICRLIRCLKITLMFNLSFLTLKPFLPLEYAAPGHGVSGPIAE